MIVYTHMYSIHCIPHIRIIVNMYRGDESGWEMSFRLRPYIVWSMTHWVYDSLYGAHCTVKETLCGL